MPARPDRVLELICPDSVTVKDRLVNCNSIVTFWKCTTFKTVFKMADTISFQVTKVRQLSEKASLNNNSTVTLGL